MLAFPNAKVNLGLWVLNKRPDGYHDIETCMVPIPWHDVLEIEEASEFSFRVTGLEIAGNQEDNLCVKAYNLLKNDFDLPPIAIHLHKVIPMGAGLGGGSADGAFMLKLLNTRFELALNMKRLESYAVRLGSDCPFFIKNLPAIASGTGTTIKTIDLDLLAKHIVVVYPGLHVDTGLAYSKLSPKPRKQSIQDIVANNPDNWPNLLTNDFEPSVFSQFPQIKQIKDQLLEMGAFYASMSGSGSAVFGLFEKEPELPPFDGCTVLSKQMGESN